MTMNFPCRSTDCTVLPRRRLARALKFCRTTCFEKNFASSIRRPVSRGASVRTTVSTSGSSGIDLKHSPRRLCGTDLECAHLLLERCHQRACAVVGEKAGAKRALHFALERKSRL